MTDAAFCRTDIDLTGLGVDRNPPFEPYFCTPEGAAWRVCYGGNFSEGGCGFR